MVGCETNTSWCWSASGFEDLLLCGSLHCSMCVIISTWHKHRISYSSGCSALLSSLHTCAFIFLYRSVGSLLFGEIWCFLHKTMQFWGLQRGGNPVCMCASVCESHYHNLQPIKKAREMRHWWFWLPCALWGMGWKKNTRPNKESAYGGTGAKRVGWESGEAFHLVSFVWVKISNENKQRKGISIIPQ